MDDIINIDECLSDSFSLSSDTDIRNIVDQWKQQSDLNGIKEQKFDTRTFTRPKKKSFSKNDVKFDVAQRNRYSSDSDALAEEATSSSLGGIQDSNAKTPSINLQIGGLVTSMQKSFLGDVSPPATILMESSFEPMGNSLITSSDFTNVNEFINGNGDSLSSAQFHDYRLSDAINDRNFLERLTNYDESLFTKEADINSIDANHLIDNGAGNGTFSGNSTLQNSTDSTSNLGRGDDTFMSEKNTNATFETTKSDGNRTFIHIETIKNDVPNSTFDLENNSKNPSFNAITNNKITFPMQETMDLLDNEQLELHESINSTRFDSFRKPEGFIGNGTVNLSKNLDLDEESGSSTTFDSPINTEMPLSYQSTPAIKKTTRESLVNISPILSEEVCLRNTQIHQPQVEKFVDVEFDDDLGEIGADKNGKIGSRLSNGFKLRDDERQSLKNFEDFENTLLMLENNKNEDEFDDLLNKFSSKNVCSPMSQKLRQSLDNIKKRHSMSNMEKQYQDELNCEKLIHSITKAEPFDRIKLNESLNKTALMSTSTSSNCSGERLLRRSRLYDDVAMSTSSGSETELLNKKNQSHLGNDLGKTEQNSYNTDESPENQSLKMNDENGVTTKAHNRDRFKTIRIFKKPPEDAIQVPHFEPESDEMNATVVMPRAYTDNVEHFSTKNMNSPQSRANAKAINTMTFKKSALARPRQLSGLQRRDMYAKSNSHEMLSSEDDFHSEQTTQNAPPLKSPMGVKSKSVHNLMSGNKIATGIGRPGIATAATTHNMGTFKVPKANVPMRQNPPAVKKLGLIRPSSGYYGYNSRRLDSDNESGKFSSNNSLSSASSKGSLNRPDQEQSTLNVTFVPASQPISVASNVLANRSAGNITRPSGLRPPTQIKRSGLPRPTNIPKR